MISIYETAFIKKIDIVISDVVLQLFFFSFALYFIQTLFW